MAMENNSWSVEAIQHTLLDLGSTVLCESVFLARHQPGPRPTREMAVTLPYSSTAHAPVAAAEGTMPAGKGQNESSKRRASSSGTKRTCGFQPPGCWVGTEVRGLASWNCRGAWRRSGMRAPEIGEKEAGIAGFMLALCWGNSEMTWFAVC